MVKNTTITGRNGVAIPAATPRSSQASDTQGYRTYEVHQRERVGESTEKIKPIQLVSDEYRHNPYPFLEILRENYPCYRDWLTNCYWITGYNDVTSIMADNANFYSRSKAVAYDGQIQGRDLSNEISVLEVQEYCVDRSTADIAGELVRKLKQQGCGDLATEFAALLPLHLLAVELGIDKGEYEEFFTHYWRMQRGVSWQPELQRDGLVALGELAAFFDQKIEGSSADSPTNLISVLGQLEIDGGPIRGKDVAITLLERDHQSLHGALANLCYLLLTHPQCLDALKAEPRMMKSAYLESVRHSTPVLDQKRYTRHEVERFGKLLPAGATVICSAAAANRDPRIFSNPQQFDIYRKDLCQREPRGQYRADGLASGITLGLGQPSIYPALPEDRPRSRYALNRDAVVVAMNVLLRELPQLRIAANVRPSLSALSVGEMHTCWHLPVEF